jgi:mono/diheme cytochrome c family protein
MRTIVACGNCHTTRNADMSFAAGMELAGGFVIEAPGFTARVPNITPDAETGIGRWTDAEIVAAIREGRRPDGSLIGPPMPISMYRGMSDGDVAAIVAYLRSVPAVRHAVPRSEYRIPLPPSWGPPVASVPEVPRADRIAYGGYLAGPLGHCLECHTPMKDGRFEFDTRLGAGGFEIPLGGGAVVLSGNVTPDRETGIGAWSDADIRRAVTAGLRPDGSQIHPIMPYGFYAGMKPDDVDAIVAFLRTLKPVKHAVR